MKNDVLDALTLWEFPPEDFCAGGASFRTPLIPTRSISGGSATGNARPSRGGRAVRVQLTIEEMLAELAAQAAQNTSENRAAIIGLVAARRRIGGL